MPCFLRSLNHLPVRGEKVGESMSGPTIDRANSSGDIWTPQVFIDAVTDTFGPLAVDLAAESHSAKANVYITPLMDSLTQDWDYDYYRRYRGLMWLNPPYSNIAPWAKKCAATYGHNEQVEILLLVPASIGANWFWDHVWPYATVYSVGRMVFDNCFDKQGNLVTTPYPKDLILAHYTLGSPSKTLQRWKWKNGN